MAVLPDLYLASGSPRRKQLLESLGLQFQVIHPQVTELEPSSKSVDNGVVQNARLKAQAGREDVTSPNSVIIAADTLVVLGEIVLGKPQDAHQVLEMLGKLSEQKHRVVTGMVLLMGSGEERTCAVSSFVKFRKISKKEMEDYALTKEPYDKAGSYAIQGLGATFIERIEGSYTNIMGFPIERFLEELPMLTGIPAFKWFLP
jgi:septum formation protein